LKHECTIEYALLPKYTNSSCDKWKWQIKKKEQSQFSYDSGNSSAGSVV